VIEIAAYAIVLALIFCSVPFGIWVGVRVNRRLGLPIPDGSLPLKRKVLAATLLIAVIWGAIGFLSGFSKPLDFIVPAAFSLVVIFIVFIGIKRK
jgi:hypothetical protein